jgi:hypothetical protein
MHTYTLTHSRWSRAEQTKLCTIVGIGGGTGSGSRAHTLESYSAEPNLANPQVTHTNAKYFMQLRMHFVTSCRGKHALRHLVVDPENETPRQHLFAPYS